MALNYTSISGFKSHISDRVLTDLTDDIPDGAEVLDEDILTQLLEEAESFVDSFAGVVYDLPLSPAPKALGMASYIVAKYNILLRRHVVEEDTEIQYSRILTWLERLADGKVSLTDPASGEELSSFTRVGFAKGDETDNPGAVFTHDSVTLFG